MSEGTQRKYEESTSGSADSDRWLEDSVYQDLTNAVGKDFCSMLFRAPKFQMRFISIFSRMVVQYIYLQQNRIIQSPYPGSLKPGSLRRMLKVATDDSELIDYRLPGYDFQAVRRHLKNRVFASSTEDRRLVLQWKDLFLVKKLYSTGMTLVPADVCHKVVAFHKHLDIYILNDGASCSQNGGACYTEGEMPETSVSFSRLVVRPFKEQIIPGGSQYILIAPSPCLFMREIIGVV